MGRPRPATGHNRPSPGIACTAVRTARLPRAHRGDF